MDPQESGPGSQRDLINSFITALFLLVVAIFTMQERNRRHLFYVGGTLCLTAAIVCLLDAFVVTKTMRSTVKRLLKVTIKTNKPEEQLSFRDRSRMHVSLPPDTHNAQN
ncbi:CKLF-like MARVEL transmembrane domain-containing protein 1 isoform X1 [Dasypus novemcinctus]|uniref:CKLF-like MARVEL transmembrane domain-containing protein 1 isoform X1 n=1 Tax=Dasypus novemcinctus TaxID=9361 RepID=UPI00266033FB|nr:CKLF-like MARVEL transmembrane domain-containing protein 1 isoform X2 [Dasypus novemcinctus]